MWQTSEPQTLDEIREWYRDMVVALIEWRASLQNAIRQSLPVASRFVGMTEDDIDNRYKARRRGLDRLTLLNLVASAEGSLKLDYFRRVKKKLKDPLSRAYRKWHKGLSLKKKQRPDFDEPGILDELKKTKLIDNQLIGRFRECLQARHWVGHGRYWDKPTAVDMLDPDDAYERADALLNAMPP